MRNKNGTFAKGHGYVDAQERFREKVKAWGDCWIWEASTNNKGYGRINIDRKIVLAHRYSFEVNVGAIPKNMVVMHTCDNPLCVKPAHLKLGTQADNMRDMSSKRRGCNGEKAPWAKLTQEKADEIRKQYMSGRISQRALAREYGVSQFTINYIINNKRWN